MVGQEPVLFDVTLEESLGELQVVSKAQSGFRKL